MTSAGRQPGGRFAPGTSGNPQGRPSTASRVRQAIERDLVQLGATPQDVARLVEASTDPLRAAAVIAEERANQHHLVRIDDRQLVGKLG